MWQVTEPIHAVTYFAPASHEALRATGLKGTWMCYFAGRASPMGAVPAAVVEATFYNFAPRLVRRAIPDAWTFAAPSDVLAARYDGVRRALEAHVADAPLKRISALIEAACDSLTCDGRVLAAANAALTLPDDPIAAMWQQVTTLREHRGDGHLAALITAGLSGLDAHLVLVGAGVIPRAVLQGARGYTDSEWDAGIAQLAGRGLLDDDGTLSAEGRRLHSEIEHATDRAAVAPWARLDADDLDELAGLLEPITASISAAGVIPRLNPMGLPAE